MNNFYNNYTNKEKKIINNSSLNLSEIEVKSFFKYTIFDKKKVEKNFYSE
ncbi:hypothetical protein ACSXEP_07245 [Clostridium perfringens]